VKEVKKFLEILQKINVSDHNIIKAYNSIYLKIIYLKFFDLLDKLINNKFTDNLFYRFYQIHHLLKIRHFEKMMAPAALYWQIKIESAYSNWTEKQIKQKEDDLYSHKWRKILSIKMIGMRHTHENFLFLLYESIHIHLKIGMILIYSSG